MSKPVQIKSRFNVQKKYEDRPGLLMCYVVGEIIYSVKHEDAVQIAQARRYTKTRAWTADGNYHCPVGPDLAADLEPYKATTEQWASLLRHA